jgi:hypothetical protein
MAKDRRVKGYSYSSIITPFNFGSCIFVISTYLLEQYKKAGQPMFMLTLKRNKLADFLNVFRPSLSREMCRMKDEGITSIPEMR